MVNGHKSAAHTDSPDGGTGKMCLGGGMHVPVLVVHDDINVLNDQASCTLRLTVPPRTGRLQRWTYSAAKNSTSCSGLSAQGVS